MDLYKESLLDHYKYPRNFGRHGEGADYLWEELNPSCGDKIGIALRVDKKAGRVTDVRFWGEGCVVSIAAASMLTEEVKKRKSLERVGEISGEDILKLIGGKETIPPARLPCAFMGLEALRKAISIKEKR